jgi:hypothetical protein
MFSIITAIGGSVALYGCCQQLLSVMDCMGIETLIRSVSS